MSIQPSQKINKFIFFKRQNSFLVFILFFYFFALICHAQEELKVTSSGRILMDAGIFDSKNKNFVDGVAIPDIRLGLKATYGKYRARLDVGYSYGKISLKEIYVNRQLSSSSLIRAGYFIHQFGLQSYSSSSMKITMEEPTTETIFFNALLIGAMYIYDKNDFFVATSLNLENEAMKQSADKLGKQGYGVMTRLVYRPFRDNGAIFHLGISGAYEAASYNADEELNHKSFVFGANFPTRISKVKALQATVTDAKHLYKFTPELLAVYGPLGLESQYYYLSVKRDRGLSHYKASGAYATVRGLITGGNYKYINSDSGIATPGAGSMEAVISYNYTDMSDSRSGILGGRLNDVAFSFNYYINKYMICRFRYSYTCVTNRESIENQKLNAFQTRFQIIF